MKVYRTFDLEGTWQEIKALSDAGKFNHWFKVGDQIPIILKDGQKITLQITQMVNDFLFLRNA